MKHIKLYENFDKTDESVYDKPIPKFKKGDKVNYIPKISGLSPNKVFEIENVKFETENELSKSLGVKSEPTFVYTFKNNSLSAIEKDIKLVKKNINESYGNKTTKYKEFSIIEHDNFYEIKGYSSDSGIFFQYVDTKNIEDVKKVIDLALDRDNDDLVKKVYKYNYNYYDIHKRIVFFSNIFKNFK